MQDARELREGPLLQDFLIGQHLRNQLRQILGFFRIPGQNRQFLQDAPLHLVRGLVGKGDSQYMPIGVRFFGRHQQADIFPCQIVCFAGTGRRLQDLKHGLQI